MLVVIRSLVRERPTHYIEGVLEKKVEKIYWAKVLTDHPKIAIIVLSLNISKRILEY